MLSGAGTNLVEPTSWLLLSEGGKGSSSHSNFEYEDKYRRKKRKTTKERGRRDMNTCKRPDEQS